MNSSNSSNNPTNLQGQQLCEAIITELNISSWNKSMISTSHNQNQMVTMNLNKLTHQINIQCTGSNIVISYSGLDESGHFQTRDRKNAAQFLNTILTMTNTPQDKDNKSSQQQPISNLDIPTNKPESSLNDQSQPRQPGLAVGYGDMIPGFRSGIGNANPQLFGTQVGPQHPMFQRGQNARYDPMGPEIDDPTMTMTNSKNKLYHGLI